MSHTPDTTGEKPYLLRPAEPGRLFTVVKVVSWIELVLFAALMVVWLAPGKEHLTFVFGLSHGIGFCVLAVVVLIACLIRQAPYPLLAATMTPLAPVGSVIGIELIERKGWGVAGTGTGRESASAGSSTPNRSEPE